MFVDAIQEMITWRPNEAMEDFLHSSVFEFNSIQLADVFVQGCNGANTCMLLIVVRWWGSGKILRPLFVIWPHLVAKLEKVPIYIHINTW